MTDQPSTRTAHTHNPDGTVTVSLTFPSELLSRLTWVGDDAADAYGKYGSDDDQVAFAEVVLSPLAAVLWRADHADSTCPDAS